MKLLVTGREGQLARSLAQRAGPGLELHFTHRPEVDLAVPGSVAQAIRAASPDVVVNAAAYTAVDRAEDEPELAQRINADAAGEAAQAAHEVGAAIIQISTDYVFDGWAGRAYCEGEPVAPLGVYGRSKLLGEQHVRAANPRHAILRTAWVFSPFGRNFVRAMMTAAQHRPELTVVSDQRGSPTSALDLADAIYALVRLWREGSDVGLGRVFHVAGSGVASWYELAGCTMTECAALGLPSVPVRPIRTSDWPTPAARPAFSALDSRSFAAATGFVMPGWQSSLRTVVQQIAGAARG